MPPRPIHRWKSLWLGLIILLFLIWAWAKSRSHSDRICLFVQPGIIHFLRSRGGYLQWDCAYGHFSGPHPPLITFDSTSRPWNPGLLPAPLRYDEHPNRPYIIRVGIACWFITLLYLIPWLTFLAWRWQRHKPLLLDKSLSQIQPS
ncbi:hypothetical protein [Luteolibacter soli]|uniref:Uncharacterized protein n=1 Tax=Luteolibacter soli TaxID=3135280 RepID=A0ABU9AX51_9BACT